MWAKKFRVRMNNHFMERSKAAPGFRPGSITPGSAAGPGRRPGINAFFREAGVREEVKTELKNIFFWICEKIVNGSAALIRGIPAADRRLTGWATRLLELMFRHRLVSAAAIVIIALVMIIAGDDGLLEPVWDTLDALADLATTLPFDVLLLVIILGSGLALGLVMYRRRVGFGQAAGLVFYGLAARLFYLTVLVGLVMFLLQFTPLKSDRRGQAPPPVPALAALVSPAGKDS